MKRQKRDRLERAHSRGYQAVILGRSREHCPSTNHQWMSGMAGGGGVRSRGGQSYDCIAVLC